MTSHFHYFHQIAESSHLHRYKIYSHFLPYAEEQKLAIFSLFIEWQRCTIVLGLLYYHHFSLNLFLYLLSLFFLCLWSVTFLFPKIYLLLDLQPKVQLTTRNIQCQVSLKLSSGRNTLPVIFVVGCQHILVKKFIFYVEYFDWSLDDDGVSLSHLISL